MPSLIEATTLTTLPNGVRVVALNLPHLETASVSVYARVGSVHESRARNGIGHVVEHMVFKGTRTRSARRINLDAERLGAEVNAHTDKDHTAFHMRGLAEDAQAFVQMLGDLVRDAAFPADELERERQVLLHEFTDDAEDPMSTAFKLFDRACFGLHPAAQPVIGTRRNIERFTRDDLADHVARSYTGAGLVVAAAGRLDGDALVRAAEAAFGSLPRGQPLPVADPPFVGGLRTRALPGCSQTHVVLGFPLPARQADDATGELAAALLGEGMSSPLMDQVREQRGLAYYAACAADVMDGWGQFVIEASTAPGQVDEYLDTVRSLLAAQAQAIDPIDLARARKQLAVQRLRLREKPHRLLEEAALDTLVLGRVRTLAERHDALADVGTDRLRAAFARMVQAPGPASSAASSAAPSPVSLPALALAGAVPRGMARRIADGLQMDAASDQAL